MTEPNAARAALITDVARRANIYLDGLDGRDVLPTAEALSRIDELAGSLPGGPGDPAAILDLLDRVGSPATVASAGPRYFGFVIGGALPTTVAANMLAAAWDQCTGRQVLSPAATVIEETAARWVAELIGLPEGCGVGLVTGASMANFSALAAARHALMARAGWDVGSKGLYGAPEIRIVVGGEVHVTVLKALALLGFGRDTAIRVPVDGQGRMIADQLPTLDDRTIVCIQAGNVNTGAFDPAPEIIARAKAAGSWVHVDGAFGLWAAAAPARAHLMAGFNGADSWATDAHKWLNTPYDCGLVFVRDEAHLRGAMAANAAYLIDSGGREPGDYVPELSRRARGVEVWAAIKALGRSGIAELVERNCRQAARFAKGLKAAGIEVLNEVPLNQVLVAFGDAERTQRVTAAIQVEGTCWCGGSVWQGRTVMRISVSSWATTDDDVERSLDAIIRMDRANA